MTPEERRTAARIHARKAIEANFPDNVKEAISSPVYGELYKNFILTGITTAPSKTITAGKTVGEPYILRTG